MKPYYQKRIELHNHTLESDGSMTVSELARCLLAHGVTTYALTDHNTISGIAKTEQYLSTGIPMEFVHGYELTSYLGHILCHNVKDYIRWEDIRMDNADLLFDRVHSMGGIVGIAHPFSASAPISNGMRFAMTIHDYHKVDFIEIVNHAHPYLPDNMQALDYWETLYLKGYAISPTSGLDLHHPDTDLTNAYTTWLLLPEVLHDAPISEQLSYAIHHQRVCISKGPVIHTQLTEKGLSVCLMSPDTMHTEILETCPYPLILRTAKGTQQWDITLSETLELPAKALPTDYSAPMIVELYAPGQSTNYKQEQPIAVAPVIHSL